MKVEQKLQMIGADDCATLIDELEAFELQMDKAGIESWRDIYRYFDWRLFVVRRLGFSRSFAR